MSGLEDQSSEEFEDDEASRNVKLSTPTLISSSNQSEMWGSIGVALFWTALSIYMVFKIFGITADWSKDGPILAVVLIVFPGVSICLLIQALIAARRYDKFGKSVFELSAQGAYVGKTMRGVIRPSKVLNPLAPSELTLECTETRQIRSASGKTRSETRSIWKESKTIPVNTYRSSRTFPVEWNIPESAMSVSDKRAKGTINWVLRLKVPTDGVDYKSEFPISVWSSEEQELE